MGVEWTGLGLDHLAEVYVTFDLAGQEEIARIVERINSSLANDPWELGESRAKRTRRLWTCDLLAVLFDIVSDDLVVVQDVALARRK
jgi:hypothetical protein